MAKIGNFNAGEVEPAKPFELIPPAYYAMKLVESETRANKGNDQNSNLTCTFEIDEAYHPELKGRKVWHQLNLWHESAETVEIANRELSAIARSVGKITFDDSEVLHNIPLAVKVGIKAASGTFEAKNVCKGFDALAARFPKGPPPAPAAGAPGAAPAAGSAPGAAARPAAAPASRPATAPWQRK